MKNAILAYDIGTSSIKATLFDEHGNSLASASKSYTTSHPVSGWAEQNLADWFGCVVSATRN